MSSSEMLYRVIALSTVVSASTPMANCGAAPPLPDSAAAAPSSCGELVILLVISSAAACSR
jgi:hypothetical protein